MRVYRLLPILACSVPLILASAVAAQGVGGGVAGGSLVVGSQMDPGNGNRKPYTATFTQKQVQTLANGTTITHESTTRTAHDSSGRTYNEFHNTQPMGPDGQPREMVTYHVFDPVARTTMMWNSRGGEAVVTHMPEPQTIAARPAPPASGMPAAVRLPDLGSMPRAARTQPDVQREDLGTKNIAGVNATGVRTTRTIPAGSEGNDQPIVVTDEIWRSKEYGLTVMSVRNDPRNGTTTREVTEFQAGEPDAALFHVPEGYTVHDIPAPTVTMPNQ
jgi:hypothetical protein